MKTNFEKNLLKEKEIKRGKAKEEKYGATGVEELMNSGNIKEAAVVFSREGMKLFNDMFMNNIESKLEQVVERKMIECLGGILEGMQTQALELNVKSIMEQVTNVNTNTITPKQEEPIREEEPKQKLTREQVYEESEILSNYLKKLGKPIHVKDMINNTPEINWGKNQHGKLTSLMKKNKTIQKASRAMYEYKEE